MKFYWLILCILSLWRITHLFQAEDGPWDISIHIRSVAGESFWGDVLDCFYCLSLWFSIPFAIFLGESFIERIFLWFGLSGAAILLERATNHEHELTTTPFIADEDKNHELL